MCEGIDCPVHSRVDSEGFKTYMGEEFFSKITYSGDWAIVTTENSYMVPLALITRDVYPHMTIVVKVGDGCLGDLMGEGDDSALSDSIYDGWFSEVVDDARNAHDMLLSGVESGILDLVKEITPREMISRQFLNL